VLYHRNLGVRVLKTFWYKFEMLVMPSLNYIQSCYSRGNQWGDFWSTSRGGGSIYDHVRGGNQCLLVSLW